MEKELYVISDFGSIKDKEEIFRKIKGKTVLFLGDLLPKSIYGIENILTYYKELFGVLENNVKEAYILLGNSDANEDFIEKILSNYKKIKLLYSQFKEDGMTLFGLPKITYLNDFDLYVLNWGNGAGIGGIRGYNEEILLYKNDQLPVSSLVPYNLSECGITSPNYSGLFYSNVLFKMIKKVENKKEIIIVSHMPPYMGKMKQGVIPENDLDVVKISRVKDVNYVKPTHVGDIPFRIILEENLKKLNLKGIYFGHVEEFGGNEINVNDIQIRNVAKELYGII